MSGKIYLKHTLKKIYQKNIPAKYIREIYFRNIYAKYFRKIYQENVSEKKIYEKFIRKV